MKINNKRLQQIIVGGFTLLWIHPSLATPTSAISLANTCSACHGTDGNSKGPATPIIAGLSAEYIKEAMKDYQTEDGRNSTIMSRIAKGYSQSEITLMADYFSQQTMHRKEQIVDKKQANIGRKLHKKYCEKCHEEGGRSADDDAGILAGQWMKYLEYTLSDFTSGQREMTRKMKKKIKKIQRDKGNQAIPQLIHYYGSQK
jgi:sulfide dehydrogenase cytochrome subunit